MSYKCLTLSIAAFLSLAAQAVTMQEVFLNMPPSMLPTLPKTSRQDLVDFITNNRTAVMPAAFGNQMVLKTFSDDFLMLETSPVSSLQLKLLPLGDTTRVVAFVHTVRGPMSNSRLLFIDPSWQPVPALQQPVFKPADFLSESNDSLANCFQTDGIRFFMTFHFDAATTDLKVTHSLVDDASAENLAPYRGVLKDTLILHWTGMGFER